MTDWQLRRELHARDRRLPLGERTYVMAILNLTDDSFSGDGLRRDIDEAVRRAVEAERQGADIIDIGAESARADVAVRNAGEEARVVSEAVGRVRTEAGLVISVDTYKGVVAEAALQAGADMINDIGGLAYDGATATAAAKYGAAFVINYTSSPPKVRPTAPPRYDDVVEAHLRFFRTSIETARRADVREESIVLDPGIAFGKSHDQDLQVLRRLGELRQLGLPILLAASRKHFIGSVLGVPPPERDAATVAVTALAIAGGVDIVRVHDVRANVHAARMADAIVRHGAGDYRASPETWPWSRDSEPIPDTTIAPSRGDADS